jgi:hypothetical protein
MDLLDAFIFRTNIAHYRRVLQTVVMDEPTRKIVCHLLVEAETGASLTDSNPVEARCGPLSGPKHCHLNVASRRLAVFMHRLPV